jgi:hypothetical protein
VDGRLILHELSAETLRVTRLENGDWTGVAPGRWKIRSPAEARFAELEHGRAVLIQAARHYASAARAGPSSRCLALASDGYGHFRLWDVARLAGATEATDRAVDAVRS